MEKEHIEYRFEDGELVAPVSHLYKAFMLNMMEIATTFDDSPLLHKYLIKIMKESFKYDDILKKTPKQFQADVQYLLDLPYETVYEMMRKKPYPYKETTKPELKLVK